MFAQERLVLGYAAEIRLLVVGIGGVIVVELLLLPFDGCIGFFAVESLSVNRAADVGEQVTVVAASTAVEIALDCSEGYRIRRNNGVGGIGRHRGNDAQPIIGCLLYGSPLLGCNAQSHTIDEHHIVFADVVQFLRVECREANAFVVVRPGDLPQRDDLIIYKSDARGGEPCVPHHDTGCDNEQGGNPCPDFSFSFHILLIFYFFLNSRSRSSDSPTEQVVPVVLGELL